MQAEEELIELETEKVNQVLYAPAAGVVTWSVNEGDTLKIGDVIGSIDTEGAPAPVAEAPQAAPAPKRAVGEGARKMEAEFVADLQEKPLAPAPQPPKVAPQPTGKESRHRIPRIRQTIGRRLVDALHTAAMLTTFNEVDMSAILELRAKHKEEFLEKHGVKLGFMSFFVKAILEGLKQFPDFNSYIDGDEIVERHYYDIGIAVGTERGLMVPVLRDCEEMSFADIEQAIGAFAEKARAGKLSLEDLQGGNFTVTNGGVYGSLLSTPILNPPQVGILGMHKIEKRAVVVDDEIVIRPMMYLALSYDHRIVDGKEAVSFLVRVKELLEDPWKNLI